MNNKYYEYLNDASENVYPVAGNSEDNYEEFIRQNMIPNSFNEMIDIQGYINNISNMNTNNNMMTKENCGLFSSYEGFSKGNMFPELYSPYRGYKPREIKTNNEQQAMMLQISELDFALIDMNLYLDVNPDDDCMINNYSKTLDKKIRLVNEYESKYGPITTNSRVLDRKPWAWNKVKSPWERGY